MNIKTIKIWSHSLPYIFGEDHEEIAIHLDKGLDITNFWGESITCVSAIVGSNGTGKTSIINAIRKGECHVEGQKIGNSNIKELGIIYYAPHLTTDLSLNDQSNVINLSKYSIMKKDTPNDTASFQMVFEFHNSQNTLRLIKFMQQNQTRNLIPSEIKLPVFDRVKISLSFINITLHDSPLGLRSFYEEMQLIIQRERSNYYDSKTKKKILDINSEKQELKLYITRALIEKLFQIYESSGGKYMHGSTDSSFDSSGLSKASDLKKYFFKFLNTAYIQFKSGKKTSLPSKSPKKLLNSILKAVDELTEIPDRTSFNTDFASALNIINNYKEFLIDYQKLFSYETTPFLTFEPSVKLSSGEFQMYNLFSLLLDTSYNITNSIPDESSFGIIIKPSCKNILLLLDEPDSTFHPQWKKRFINTLISVLPKIFKGKNIQIIFTTHDPLTLSDIPHTNISYLEKINDRIIISSEVKKSFGANVSDLLTDSFFIQDGLLGDFALNKINGTIKWINESRESRSNNFEEEFEIHKRLTELIDEPIIRMRLQEMLNELKDNDQSTIYSKL